MPTIEQLNSVVVSADDDAIPVSQGGIMRRVTRAQLLTGMQSSLSLSPGLLGRTSPGFGAPEQITVGSGLSFANGVLSGAPGFSVTALPASTGASAGDLIAVSHGGRDGAVSVGALLSVPGANVSGQYVTGPVGIARRLADWVADSLAVEMFGAIGDGTTDDTVAFKNAVASGRPVMLGPKTYRVDGQWSITTSAILIGTPGMSSLRRTSQSGGAWIEVSAASFAVYGIRFDGGGLGIDSWGLLVDPTCKETIFEKCQFLNMSGPTLGSGLVIQARDGLSGHSSSHTVRSCTFSNNRCHGLWIQAAAGAIVEYCVAHDNGVYGICLDFNDATFQNVVRQSAVTGCRCWQNQRGISIGNYNETNVEPPRWGLANPDAVDILVSGNVCSDNFAYAIAVSGRRIRVCENQINVGASASGASGILCNASKSTINGNVIDGPGMFGIDAGGCIDCEISSNLVDSFDVGINAGGGQSVRVTSNRLLSNGRGVTAFQVETDGIGGNFGLPCKDLLIDGNTIALKDSSGGGVILADGPEGVVITANAFRAGPSSHSAQAIMANTDSITTQRNTWCGSDVYVASAVGSDTTAQVTCPEVFDRVIIMSTTGPISAIVGEHAASVSGQVSFVRVTDGGAGYTVAAVTIAGSGTGAMATTYIRDGTIVGIALASGGGGYGQSATQVSITGDGNGATGEAFIGLPVPQGKRLAMRCDVPARFIQGTGNPAQSNWTGCDITIPSGSEIIWVGVAGGWKAVSFTSADYIVPDGSGALSVRSIHGDVALMPSSDGRLRVCSPLEPSGFTSNLGRGSPEGVVAAPPGSDYRNLDGGSGATLWIKRTGMGPTGWVSIA